MGADSSTNSIHVYVFRTNTIQLFSDWKAFPQQWPFRDPSVLISNTGFDAQSVKRMHKEDDAEELQFVAENTRSRAKQQRDEMNVIDNSNFFKQHAEPPVKPGVHSGANVDETLTDESAAAVPSKTPVVYVRRSRAYRLSPTVSYGYCVPTGACTPQGSYLSPQGVVSWSTTKHRGGSNSASLQGTQARQERHKFGHGMGIPGPFFFL